MAINSKALLPVPFAGQADAPHGRIFLDKTNEKVQCSQAGCLITSLFNAALALGLSPPALETVINDLKDAGSFSSSGALTRSAALRYLKLSSPGMVIGKNGSPAVLPSEGIFASIIGVDRNPARQTSGFSPADHFVLGLGHATPGFILAADPGVKIASRISLVDVRTITECMFVIRDRPSPST